MPTFHLIRAFLDQATAQGSRSTILRPLGWLIAICASATLGAVEFKAPTWLTVLFGACAGLGVLLYLGAYIYCLATGKEDLLRSETYSIQKLAIEKGGFVGDSVAGVFPVDRDQSGHLLSGTIGQDAAEGEK
jgi:hypothetical protein